MINQTDKIVITGAAGLVGQNLALLLRENGFNNIVAIDKHADNLTLLQQLNPGVKTVNADLSESGDWKNNFQDAKTVVMLHAQITSLVSEEFEKNNILATDHVLDAIKHYQIPFTVHVSSSVVNSVANDDYTNTKKIQEKNVLQSGIACCVLRPTLMFGWFDPKHFGWLSRFMEKTPVFPVPGDGKYLRQPLYSRDFCRVIIVAMQKKLVGKTFDIVGLEEMDYIDMIYFIKRVKKLKTKIIKLPYWFFYLLMKAAGLILRKPPFTTDQLKALTAGDYFQGVDYEAEFGFMATPLKQAFLETYAHPTYAHIVVKR